MAQWQIKEISDLTKVSVRTLHHYDKIGLLKPSGRTESGYRWYSEQDLVRLQQIIALKYFGFSLGQIKTMLEQTPSIWQHLQAQREMLVDQAEHLRQAQNALEVVLKDGKTSDSLDWNNLVSLIERYRMIDDLKNTWMSKLSESQQAELIAIKQEFPKEIASWEKAIKTINSMELGDPEGPDGERMVKIFLDLAKRMKASMSRQRKLNSDLMRDIKAGKLSDDALPLSPEGNMWLAKASLTYYLKRWEQLNQDILKNLKADPEGAAGEKIAKAWRELIGEHFIGTSPDLAIGTMFWQEFGRQRAELQEQKAPVPVQEQMKKIHVSLFFNPEAMNWIEQALNKH